MHNPIQITELSLQINTKHCFDEFSYTIYPGEKIAIIGNNGCGKSALLKLIANLKLNPQEEITGTDKVCCAYVPQIITKFNNLSGGQRFNKALSQALANSPNLLLLDEPTNHLDTHNRNSLMQLIKNSLATIIVVSHDVELLDRCINTLWHIHDGKISIFKGTYSNYRKLVENNKNKLMSEITHLKQAQKHRHEALMKEQRRAKNSREQGEKHIRERKWPTITSGTKARRAETTAGKNNATLNRAQSALNQQLSQLWQPEEISYSFKFNSTPIDKAIITIGSGSCGYLGGEPILDNINFTLFGLERIAISGSNGSGKSTLVKALMNNPEICKTGDWLVPNRQDIAYLDQHYSNLSNNSSVLDFIHSVCPTMKDAELRNFLNQFLFRKNEEVNKLVSSLSGGEKARLSLAMIALQQPKLLILDEITNNLDLITKEHVIQVLQNYAGALLVISHDAHFLKQIQITANYDVALWRASSA